MTFGFPASFDIDGTPANAFPKAAFDGIEFAYSEVQVKGGIRHARHEFPHSPGAEIEKQGRHPYAIQFTCTFHFVKGSALDREYPELYPTRLRQLRERFEKEITADLVVPNIGTIKAVCVGWHQTFKSEHASGETVVLEFLEDQDAAKAFEDQTTDFGATALAETNDALLAALALADFKKAATQSIFQDINDAVTFVQGILGQADAFSNLVAGKIAALNQLISFADSTVEELQDPVNYQVLEALKDLWATCTKIQNEVLGQESQIRVYTVPRLMSVGQIAVEIFGSSEKVGEVLQINSFADEFAVPAGTKVKYVSPAAASSDIPL